MCKDERSVIAIIVQIPLVHVCVTSKSFFYYFLFGHHEKKIMHYFPFRFLPEVNIRTVRKWKTVRISAVRFSLGDRTAGKIRVKKKLPARAFSTSAIQPDNKGVHNINRNTGLGGTNTGSWLFPPGFTTGSWLFSVSFTTESWLFLTDFVTGNDFFRPILWRGHDSFDQISLDIAFLFIRKNFLTRTVILLIESFLNFNTVVILDRFSSLFLRICLNFK